MIIIRVRYEFNTQKTILKKSKHLLNKAPDRGDCVARPCLLRARIRHATSSDEYQYNVTLQFGGVLREGSFISIAFGY